MTDCLRCAALERENVAVRAERDTDQARNEALRRNNERLERENEELRETMALERNGRLACLGELATLRARCEELERELAAAYDAAIPPANSEK